MGYVLFGLLIICFFAKYYVEAKHSQSNEELSDKLQQHSFHIDKEIIIRNQLGLAPTAIVFDFNNRKLAFLSQYRKPNIDIILFADIIECEIIEDNSTIVKGGIGRAVVGGVLAGGVGAMVGATSSQSNDVTNSLSVRIITTNLANPLVTIPLITNRVNRHTSSYKKTVAISHEIYATIVSIIHSNNKYERIDL